MDKTIPGSPAPVPISIILDFLLFIDLEICIESKICDLKGLIKVDDDNYFSASGAGGQPYQIQYSKGKVIEDGKYKGQKTSDTLEVDEPVLHRSGPEPDDVEIDADVVNYNPKAEVHDTSVLESYATGKKVKSRGSGEVYDPWEGYSPDLKADKAEGGRVSLSKGGLAKILGV